MEVNRKSFFMKSLNSELVSCPYSIENIRNAAMSNIKHRGMLMDWLLLLVSRLWMKGGMVAHVAKK
jgi:hypothetical protein